MSAREVFDALKFRGWKLSTAESCTGGIVAAAITDIAGSSDVFDRGFVTYSNAAKCQMLGVPAELISLHGAVSEEVARAMAEGALSHSLANVAVSTTGIAGPGGGTDAKPVGLVHFACATQQGIVHTVENFGNHPRAAIRKMATDRALVLVLAVLENAPFFSPPLRAGAGGG